MLTFTLFIALVLLMSALAAIISWAAFKIHTTLKKAIYSSRLKELHRQMFVLLLLQVCTAPRLYPVKQVQGTYTTPYFSVKKILHSFYNKIIISVSVSVLFSPRAMLLGLHPLLRWSDLDSIPHLHLLHLDGIISPV